MYTVTTTPRYIPRHAAPGRLSCALGRFIQAGRWIAWKMDQPMNEAEMCLCGAVLGLGFAWLLMYCYFG